MIRRLDRQWSAKQWTRRLERKEVRDTAGEQSPLVPATR